MTHVCVCVCLSLSLSLGVCVCTGMCVCLYWHAFAQYVTPKIITPCKWFTKNLIFMFKLVSHHNIFGVLIKVYLFGDILTVRVEIHSAMHALGTETGSFRKEVHTRFSSVLTVHETTSIMGWYLFHFLFSFL